MPAALQLQYLHAPSSAAHRRSNRESTGRTGHCWRVYHMPPCTDTLHSKDHASSSVLKTKMNTSVFWQQLYSMLSAFLELQAIFPLARAGREYPKLVPQSDKVR